MSLLIELPLASSISTLQLDEQDLDIVSNESIFFSVVTSVSIVTGSSENGASGNVPTASTADRKRVMPVEELPGSPAVMLRPDKFQFYTFNKDGNVVTKQMTEQEIQSLIAAGGGHLPMEIHDHQNAGDVSTGGMKVSALTSQLNIIKIPVAKVLLKFAFRY